MKKELLLIINSLTGDEYVELKIRSRVGSDGWKTVRYEFDAPEHQRVFEPVKTQSKPVKEEGEPDVKTDTPVPFDKPKTTRNRKAGAISPNPDALKEKVSEQELPAKVDYATFQMERAKDLLDGGDFDAAIAILQQACDADRKNKKLAEALYDVKMAKAKVALNDDEPLQEIKLPGRTSAQPAVEEPVQDEEAAEETF